jgi:hypothetical protein
MLVDEGIADSPKPADDGAIAPAVAAADASGTVNSVQEAKAVIDTPADKPSADEPATAVGARKEAFDTFLDRLMHAESGGRSAAANPRSTALGPFQFIKSTFLDVARRHYGLEVQELSDDQLLQMRTDRAFARRCAEVYSKENLAFLSEQGLRPTFGHLRLAFLLGPYAAARVLQAKPATPVSQVLGPSVIRANPFMARMSASNLVAKASRDVGESVKDVDAAQPAPHVRTAAVAPRPVSSPRPVMTAHAGARAAAKTFCNARLASCRKFTIMQRHRTRLAHSRVAQSHAARSGRKASAEARRRGAGA